MLKDELLDVHHTAVCVTDFERARDFYVDFLGFELEGEADNRSESALGDVVGLKGATIRWAMLRRGSHCVELFKYYQPEGNRTPREQCDLGYTHMAMRVRDVDAVFEQAVAAGYEPVSTPRVLRGGKTKVFYLREPEGAITEFIQFNELG